MSISPRTGSHYKHPQSIYLDWSPAVAAVYTLLAIAAGLALRHTLVPMNLEHMWMLGLFGLLLFVLILMTVPAKSFNRKAEGFVAFDLLPVTALLLLVGPALAAWAASITVLILTLVMNFRHERPAALLLQALGNASIYLLACLLAGYAWIAVGGTAPLTKFTPASMLQIIVLIIVLHVITRALYIALSWPGRSPAARRYPIHWSIILFEFIVAWMGVAAARAFLTLALPGFALYLLLILVIATMLKLAVRAAEREQSRTVELAAVNRVNQAVNAATDLDTLIEIIFREVQTLMPSSAFLFALFSPDGKEVDIRLNYDEGQRHPPSKREIGEGLLGWVLANRQSVLVADMRATTHPAVASAITFGNPSVALIAAPVEHLSDIVGAISLQEYFPNAFRKHHLELLESFARQIGGAIVNKRLVTTLQTYQQELEQRVAHRTRELKQASDSLQQAMQQKEELLRRLEAENRRDALTGLANRRYLRSRMRQERYRARRFKHPLSIAVADIDQFKRVNDRWGHIVGDKVLMSLATLFRDGLRATDFPARYGGEEFVILLPETPLAGALTVCEKLRARVANHPWDELADGLEVTISIGVSGNPGKTRQDIDLLANADAALYKAKAAGRNCVCGAEEEPPPDSIPEYSD